MTFIEIGNYKINLDLILWARKGGGNTINVVFSGRQDAEIFSGQDAIDLWKAIHAKDVSTL
jgi:hypothetical protein